MYDENNPNNLDKDTKKSADSTDKKKYSTLAKQIQYEYDLAFDHQKSKKDEALKRLKLYNNQRRKKKDVGDTTLFTIHQTVLASLYTDRLVSEWVGREEGDEDVADNLNVLAAADYEDSRKDELDYYWDWDALFFGRGLINFSEYLRDPENNIYLPVAENIDAVLFMRDPRAASINGNRLGRNGARFFGWETMMGKNEMEEHPHFFAANNYKRVRHSYNSTKSLLEDASSARDDAQGRENQKNKPKDRHLGANEEFKLTVWFTNWMIGGEVRKCKVWLANERKDVVGLQVLKTDYWSVIDRPLYPSSHDWDGTSIPDLVEDKQRARAVAQNLGLQAMKADLYPMYIYDSNKILNKNDLNFNFNKFIPANGDPNGILTPLRKSFPNLPLLNFIYESLDMSAQKATATPDIQQGIQSDKDRPLGETNLVASRSDTRYSLSAKIFGWSEKRYWLQWYGVYKENFDDKIDEKVVRLVGAFGPKWRKLTKENITTKKLDPDVSIQSEFVSRAKQAEERQGVGQFLQVAFSDPSTNRRYGLKKMAKLYGMRKDEIDRLMPPTIDERIADDENTYLDKNEVVIIRPEDDHIAHLEIHAKANPTAATFAHIEAHKRALMVKKVKPDLFPQDPQQQQLQQQGQQPGQQSQNRQLPPPRQQPSGNGFATTNAR